MIWWFLTKSRAGLILRAVAKITHQRMRWVFGQRGSLLAIICGGALAGIGGSYLTLVQTPLFVEGMTAGRGWIALALVVFASWRPFRVIAGAYLFGSVSIIQLHGQALGVSIASQWLSMLPYVVTIGALVIIAGRNDLTHNPPERWGQLFERVNNYIRGIYEQIRVVLGLLALVAIVVAVVSFEPAEKKEKVVVADKTKVGLSTLARQMLDGIMSMIVGAGSRERTWRQGRDGIRRKCSEVQTRSG